VLVVDDSELLLRALEYKLRSAFEVVATSDVDAAVAAVEARPRFDGFITDLEMPRADGYTLIQRVSVVDPRLAARAVIVTGAVLEDSEMTTRLSLGFYILRKDSTTADIVNAVLLRAVQHP